MLFEKELSKSQLRCEIEAITFKDEKAVNYKEIRFATLESTILFPYLLHCLVLLNVNATNEICDYLVTQLYILERL